MRYPWQSNKGRRLPVSRRRFEFRMPTMAELKEIQDRQTGGEGIRDEESADLAARLVLIDGERQTSASLLDLPAADYAVLLQALDRSEVVRQLRNLQHQEA